MIKKTDAEIDKLVEDNGDRIYDIFGYVKSAFNSNDPEIRYNAYEILGYTKDAFNDNSEKIRLNAFNAFDMPKEALKDKSEQIRKEALNKYGYSLENIEGTIESIALKKMIENKNEDISNLKYSTFIVSKVAENIGQMEIFYNEIYGKKEASTIISKLKKIEKIKDIKKNKIKEIEYNDNAKKEKCPSVRLKAYQSLGLSKEALNDKCSKIRMLALNKFGFNNACYQNENDPKIITLINLQNEINKKEKNIHDKTLSTIDEEIQNTHSGLEYI